MDGSSRASAPPQLTLVPVRAPTSPVAGTPQSADSMVRLPSASITNNPTTLTRRQTSGPFSATDPYPYTYTTTSPTYGSSSPTYASGYTTTTPYNTPSTYHPSGYGSGYSYAATSASRTSSTSTAAPLLGSNSRMAHGSSSAACAAPRTAVAAPLVSPKKVNANSYCGRHSDEFLFGGKGFGDLWRAVVKK